MSDTYYCAKTGKAFEADWDVRCECTTCMPLDAPPPAPPGIPEVEALQRITRPARLEQDKDFKSWLLMLGSAYENWHAADQRAADSKEWAAHRLRCKARYEECESHLLAALAHARAEAKREAVEEIVTAVNDEAERVQCNNRKSIYPLGYESAARFIAQHFGRTE